VFDIVDKAIFPRDELVLHFLMDDEEQAHAVQLIIARGLYNAVKPNDLRVINLDLPFWHAVLTESVPLDSLEKVDKILQRFVDIGTANSLDGTVTVRKLQNAILLIKNPPKKQPSWVQRISHSENVLLLPLVHADIIRSDDDVSTALAKLSQLAIDNVPLFNI
jgi:hypothetical protein